MKVPSGSCFLRFLGSHLLTKSMLFRLVSRALYVGGRDLGVKPSALASFFLKL